MKDFFKRSLRISQMLMLVMLVAAFGFVGCSDDEEDEEPQMTGKIEGLELSLSASGQFVRLSFAAAGDDLYYEFYRSDNGGEFTDIKTTKDTIWTDRTTEFGTVYKYFVKYQNMYSDTIEIETLGLYKPRVSTSVRTDGYGSSAVVEYIKVEWSVGADDGEGIEKFDVFRDGVSVYSYEVTQYQYGKDYEWEDSDNINFDQTYTYMVKTTTDEGEVYESESVNITPERPDDLVLETPEIVDVEVDFDAETISVYITDIGAGGNLVDKIEYDIELVDLSYGWEGETLISNLGTGGDDTMVLGLDASEAPNESGFQTLRSRVRIYTQGQWTDWSPIDNTQIILP